MSFQPNEKRRHSVPANTYLTLEPIEENDPERKSTKLLKSMKKMSVSPTTNCSKTTNSPKEKRSFALFRTRTDTASSNESNGPSSPRLSPRTFFDKVRKRSTQVQNDLKTTIFATSPISTVSNKKTTPIVSDTSNRKRLNHSISEENDEILHEKNNNYTETTYKTYHAGSIDIPKLKSTDVKTNRDKMVSFSANTTTNQLIGDLNNLNMNSHRCLLRTLSECANSESTTEPPIENHQIFTYFMKHKFCYDIMPKSAKIVVFDTQLLVKKAFFALIYNGVRAAPLWDSRNQKFVGMLTITDFILILQKYYRQPNAKIEELEEHKLETWREVLKEYRRPFISLRPEDTLFEAIKVLTQNRVHRLPIIDPVTGNVVCIATHKRILRYLYLYIYDMPQPDFLKQSIYDLGIGTFKKIETVQTNTPIIEALNLFVATRVSALPVVDGEKKLVNIYSKFDVIDLAAEKTYTNLNITVIEALQYRKNRFEGVASCFKHESLAAIMERIVKKEVHRLIVVDETNLVLGVVSLSDILTYIVLKQEQITNQRQKISHSPLSASLSASAVLTRDSNENSSSLATSSVFDDDMMEIEGKS